MKQDLSNGKLDSIVDNMLLFFPLYYRTLLRTATAKSKANPVNMELRSLFILIEVGSMPSSEMGRRLGISKPNVTPLVDKLIEKSYVIRVPDRLDRRVINIGLTDKGRRFAVAKRRALARTIKTNLSTLKPGDVQTLHSAVEKIRNIISKVGEAR
jgi:DNA-binding MarR family transcriptional regulator